jgi:predicted ferric reductase
VARLEGPYGEFSYLNMRNKRQVWVAGGIGITPFLSMARSLSPGEDYDIHLFHGVKTKNEAYFADELDAIAQRVPGFNFTAVPEDERGFITVDDICGTADMTTTDVLICGPPAMVVALSSKLLERGVPAQRVHGERFGFGPRV